MNYGLHGPEGTHTYRFHSPEGTQAFSRQPGLAVPSTVDSGSSEGAQADHASPTAPSPKTIPRPPPFRSDNPPSKDPTARPPPQGPGTEPPGTSQTGRFTIDPPDARSLDSGHRPTACGNSRKVSKFIKQADLGRPGSCHLLRHTCATHVLEGGADI